MLAVSKTISYPVLPNVYTFYWLNYPIHQLKKTHHQHTKITNLRAGSEGICVVPTLSSWHAKGGGCEVRGLKSSSPVLLKAQIWPKNCYKHMISINNISLQNSLDLSSLKFEQQACHLKKHWEFLSDWSCPLFERLTPGSLV